jgi:hypothetical protein
MSFVIDLYTDATGYCAFDPATKGQAAWLHETSEETGAVILVTVDEPATLDRSALLTETLVSTLHHFPCPSGRLLVCAAEYLPANDPNPDEKMQCLNIEVPSGEHSLKVFRLTWANPAKAQALYPEDILIGLAIALIILSLLSCLISLILLLAGTLLYLLQFLLGWYPVKSIVSLLRLLFTCFSVGLAGLILGMVLGDTYEKMGRVKKHREEIAKFRLTRPEFWLHLETKDSEANARH